MSRRLAIAFFVHALRSDWNNGNAHFLRGLARAMGSGPPAASTACAVETQGHHVTIFEPHTNWSTTNLATEANGSASISQFHRVYPELKVIPYTLDRSALRACLAEQDVVIVHEWNEPELIEHILSLRDELGFRALFHDTHHRASSSPEQMQLMQIARFNGVIAFGEALRAIYLSNFGIARVWTLHEAADTSVFYPRPAAKQNDVLWVGNWGDDERTREIREFLIHPACALASRSFLVYGVRYPQIGLQALESAGIRFGGYLPNLDAPCVYAASRLTVHIPRQQYAGAMAGIPTIRVFEALASGIPLISAPWSDVEGLFAEGDFLFARSAGEMAECMEHLLTNPAAAEEQATRGLATVLGRHTCAHRARELTAICNEVLG